MFRMSQSQFLEIMSWLSGFSLMLPSGTVAEELYPNRLRVEVLSRSVI